jgi:cyclase
LLVLEGGLVKTRRFREPKYVGDPINAVKIFNEKQVDELMMLDIGAWKAKAPDYGLLEKVAVESRMPLCYGGGVATAEQAVRIINIGFEKVSLSSAAIASPALVSEVAAAIGGQSAVVTIDVARDASTGKHDVFVENGRRRVNRDLFDLCDSIVAAGAGEIVINSIDREGEMRGYDIDLARRLATRVPVPMTFVGGAGNMQHIRDLLSAVGIVGAGVGTMFVFKGPLRAVLITYARP